MKTIKETVSFDVLFRPNRNLPWNLAVSFNNFKAAREGVEDSLKKFPTFQIKITRHYEKVVTIRRHKVMKKWL